MGKRYTVDELSDEIKKLHSEGEKPAVQFEDPREHVQPNEDCMMAVDGEADRRKKLKMRKKKKITKELRKIEDFKNIREKSGSKSWRKLNG